MEHCAFNNPEELFRGTDFWMLNGDLTEDEIVAQLHQMKEKGVYSFIARTYLGLKSDYPGPNFKSKMRLIINTAKKLGLKVFLQAGYMPEAVLGLPEDHALRYIYPVKEGEEDGRRVICRHGEWIFVEHNSVTFLDMFDSDAMEHYLKVSYGEMWAEFAEEFGKTAISVWVDEPSYNGKFLPWTPRIEEKFLARFGYELAEKVWMLYFDGEGCETLRYHYRTLMRDLLEENYFKKVQAWCHSHNLMFSGHLMAEDTLASQISRAASCMPYYRYFDIPGMDVLKANMPWVDDPIHTDEPGKRMNQWYITAMQCVSMAHQSGKEHILAEMYGVGGENFTFRNMINMFDSFAACGINHRSVHGIFYTLHGRGKRAYPPHVNYYQPFWAKYKNVTDYCARVSAFISAGESVADVAVIHPLETAYTMYRLDPEKGSSGVSRLDSRFVELLRSIRSGHANAHLVDLASLWEMGRVENGEFCVGKMRYKTVILPYLRVVTSELLQLLETFAAEGGRILTVGALPDLLDGIKSQDLSARIAAISYQTDSILDLVSHIPENSYSFEGAGKENVFINRRVDGDAEAFMVYNNDYAHVAELRFSTRHQGTLYLYNAQNGAITEYPSRTEGEMLVADITVPEGGSVLLSVEPRREDAEEAETAPSMVSSLKVAGAWQAKAHHDNVLFMEYCQVREGEGEFSGLMPILAVQRLLTQRDYRGKITLRFAFESETALDNLTLALEDPAEQSIALDGREIDNTDVGYYWDRTFRRVALGHVEAGKHIIEITRDFSPLTKTTNALTQLFETRRGVELEPMYLLGKFGVRGHRSVSSNGCVTFERDFVLTECKELVETAGDLTSVGFPFYAGEMTLSREITLPDGDWSQAKLCLDVMNAGCGEVLVNGVYVGDINRAPAALFVGNALREGKNLIEIHLYSTLYNIIGPFHRPLGDVGNTFGGGYVNPDAAWLSVDTTVPDWEKKMDTFYPTWTDRYNVVPFGIRGVSLIF